MKKTAWWRAAAAALLAAAFGAAHAEASQAKGQAPGWYRMMLGKFEVTALSDGTVELPVDKLLTNIAADRVQALLARSYLKSPLETSVTGYLVNTGSKLVLIDSGAGVLFGPTLGRLVTHLKASGYQPEQVDEVYVTHMHGDHVGGLVSNGQRVFPNAVVRADLREGGFWLDKARADAAPDAMKPAFQGANIALGPYVAAGKFKPFDGETELVPGVRAIPARGHTAGHTVYAVESEGQRLVVWGDLMHVAAVQFTEPTATMQFDTDSKAAMPERQKHYADAAQKGYYAAVAHVSFPGIGRLRANGGGYDWLPANYTTANK